MQLKQIFILISFCSLVSCGQTKDKDNIMQTQQQTITIDNVTDIMYSNMPKYSPQPMYLLRINHAYCGYEVLVNDFLLDDNYTHKVYVTAEKINFTILKSGEQTVTIRMYPLGNSLKKEFESSPYFDTLEGGSGVTVEVIRVDDWANYSLESERIIKKVTSEGSENNQFVGAKLPYYEFTFSFNAEVPFENEGWSNGVDLRKYDKEKLKKQVLNYFQEYQTVHEKGDINTIVNKVYGKEYRFAESKYQTKEYTQSVWDEYLDEINKPEKEFQPLKDYELAFYGNGRIVTLKHSSLLGGVENPRLRGRSASYFLYNNKTRARFLGIYLMLPKEKADKGLMELEMIK